MYDFSIVKPNSLKNAVEALKTAHEPKLLAGGMTLLPVLKSRLAHVGTLIDLGGIEELKTMHVSEHRVDIGGMVRHYDVAIHNEVKAKIPALSYLAANIADRQVRYRGTIGGSIANADPAADYPAAVIALDAHIVTTQKTIAAEDFFESMFTTSLNEDEIVTQVSLAIPDYCAYEKIKSPTSGYALCGVFIAGYQSGFRVAVTGAASNYFRHKELESALDSGISSEQSLEIDPPDQDYLSDLNAPADYRKHLVKIASSRAISRLNNNSYQIN